MRITIILSALLVLFFFSGQSFAGGTLQLIIEPVFNGKPLHQDQLYVTANGDSVYINLFRFYISGINISENGRLVQENNSYHLIDIDDEKTLTLEWKDVPANTYQLLSFYLGIDSVTNMSGAMGGDLDPAKAMYWAWNTGYINAKMEGRSNACKTLHHAFEFHIGGFHAPYNSLRKASLPLENVTVKDGIVTIIRLQADVAEWFSGVYLKTENSITDPGAAAMKMADNYAHMLRQAPQNSGK